jgi:aminoglycoside phosphotransferase (APT) family kinase protein
MTNYTEISLGILQQAIPQLINASAIEPIHKGYSTDLKIIVHSKAGGKQLLRLFDLKDYAQKQLEYETLKSMEKYEVKCSKTLAFGEIITLNKGYMLVSYIEGEDAAEELPSYTEEQQFQIGVDAGQELLKIMYNNVISDTS